MFVLFNDIVNNNNKSNNSNHNDKNDNNEKTSNTYPNKLTNCLLIIPIPDLLL